MNGEGVESSLLALIILIPIEYCMRMRIPTLCQTCVFQASLQTAIMTISPHHFPPKSFTLSKPQNRHSQPGYGLCVACAGLPVAPLPACARPMAYVWLFCMPVYEYADY